MTSPITRAADRHTVMAQLGKPKKPQAETPDVVQDRDFFQTPNYATDVVAAFLPQGMTVWECACGNGKIVDQLRFHGFNVFGTDLLTGWNFLADAMTDHFDMIVTNPPFSIKRKFYLKCREYGKPFALLIPADYSGWIIEAVRGGCEKIIPTRRIDYITPTGRNGKTSAAQFHSMWLTWGLGLGKSETFVELTNEMKRNI